MAASGKSAADWQADLGFDLGRDVSSVTVGLLPGASASNPPKIVFILRGTFSPEKITASALKKNAEVTTIGKYTFIKAGSQPDLIPFGKRSNRILFTAIDDKTLLLAEKATVSAVIDALDGKAPSYNAPASLTALARETGTPFLCAHWDKALFLWSQTGGPDTFTLPNEAQLAFGASDSTLVLRLTASFPLESTRNASRRACRPNSMLLE